MDSVDVRINQCISADAPGAKELATFQSALNSRIARRSASKLPADHDADGVALEQNATIKPREPATDSKDTGKAPLVTSQTQVDNIHVTNLPAATFEPPTGFRKIVT
jgi:hypothetical protein